MISTAAVVLFPRKSLKQGHDAWGRDEDPSCFWQWKHDTRLDGHDGWLLPSCQGHGRTRWMGLEPRWIEGQGSQRRDEWLCEVRCIAAGSRIGAISDELGHDASWSECRGGFAKGRGAIDGFTVWDASWLALCLGAMHRGDHRAWPTRRKHTLALSQFSQRLQQGKIQRFKGDCEPKRGIFN